MKELHQPCSRCGETNPREFWKNSIHKNKIVIRTSCKSCSNIQTKEWRIKNPKKSSEHRIKYSRSEKGRATRKAAKQRLRTRCLEKLGGKCNWKDCNWTDPRALHIDHVKGGGNKERKILVDEWSFYKKVLSDRAGIYQLLCANHNMIKKHENNEYGKGASRKHV